jgi:hypothetical protein
VIDSGIALSLNKGGELSLNSKIRPTCPNYHKFCRLAIFPVAPLLVSVGFSVSSPLSNGFPTINLHCFSLMTIHPGFTDKGMNPSLLVSFLNDQDKGKIA